MNTALVLKEWFGVKPAAGRVAAALYEANGQFLTKAQLIEASRQTGTGVAISLKLLRQDMDAGAIEFITGSGYRMSPAGLADCANALADAEKREREAALVGTQEIQTKQSGRPSR
jgi:hypothetical protein